MEMMEMMMEMMVEMMMVEMSGGCTHLKAATTLEAETQSLSSLEEETGRLNLIMMAMRMMTMMLVMAMLGIYEWVKHENWYCI